MRSRHFLWGLSLLVCSGCAIAQSSAAAPVSSETRNAVRQIIGDTVLNGQAYEYDGYLADRIGPRMTGSANYMRAAAWATQQFTALGLAHVHTEEWTIATTWEPEAATGHIVTPVDHQLHIYSAGWSSSTPKQGVEGEVVYVSSLLPADLDKQKAKLAGAIALLNPAIFSEATTFDGIFRGLDYLQSLSPKAILMAGDVNGTEVMDDFNLSGTTSSVPEAQIGMEDVLLIGRLLADGPVTVQFSLANHIRKNVKIPNVIAEIPGSEEPDKVVIVGAHLDSWQPGTGAQDNGTGVASVIETARVIMALHHPPRRTIRFILFGGEEQGMLGSTAYARRHVAELPNIDAMLVTDSGSEPAKGWMVMGREDEKSALGDLKPLLAGLGGTGIDSDPEFIFQTDHAAFDVLGVPSLVLWTSMDKYMALHHKASDTFDSVVPKDLTQNAAVIAVTAYAIADSAHPFAAHLSAAEVQSMLRPTGHLEEYNYLKGVAFLP